jgi:NAD(P)H dehydrogenase (quinone)
MRDANVTLVTGAGGKTGRAVLRALGAEAGSVRGLVRSEDQAAAAMKHRASEVVVGDMRTAETMAEAMRGARAVYHIPPNMAPDEVALAEVAIEAAVVAGVEHFVYHSVLHPQTEAMPHHWQKLHAEERLLESALPLTILQPAVYMQNALAYGTRIAEDGVYPVPYAADAGVSMVDLDDVARAAAIVLTEPGHTGATYELCGREILSAREIAEIFTRSLGRPVRAEVISRDTWAEGAREAGLGDYEVETLLAMFTYYERYGLVGNPNVLEWILARPATDFEAFVGRAWSKSREPS